MTSPKRISVKPRPAGTLKDATDRLVNAVGGQDRAADLSRVGRSTMARYTDPAEPDRHMPADIIRVLEAESDYPHVSAFLAREAGFGLMPVTHKGAGADVPGLVAQVSRQSAEAVAVTVEALADLNISKSESGEIVNAVDDALRVLQRLRKVVRDRGSETENQKPEGG